jgi:LPXTG-motif cell wall-anchored protein
MIIDHSQLDVWIEHFDVVASGAGASPAAAGGAAGATSASGRVTGTSLPATGSRVRAWVAFGALALGAALVAARRRVGRGDMTGR